MSDGWGKAFTTLATLNIPNPNGWPWVARGTVVGDLFVHQPITRQNGVVYRITHVPTLAGLPCDHVEATDQSLIEWCRTIQSLHTDSWAALRRATPQDYLEDVWDDAKDEIERLCENTKLE